ncbi:GNAT family N-acetyltransferase (plasmid) [Coraliomargarita sp. W4R53]
MTTAPDAVTVTRNDEQSRYEIHVGEQLAGFTEYEMDAEGRADFPHTEIDSAFAGRGLAKALVGEAMTDIASRSKTVVPHCSYVAKFLRENPVADLEVEWPEEAPSE